MKKIILYIILLINISCSTYQKEEYININIEGALSKKEQLEISDIGEHIVYIPLETKDESLIGKRAYVRMLNDKLLIASFQQPIKMFDKKTGKFIKTIGKIGQGAYEYTLQEGMPIFWIDEENGIIYVQSEGRKIVRFNENGEAVDIVELPDVFPFNQAASQVALNNQLFVYQKSLFKKYEDKILVYNILHRQIENKIANTDDPVPMDLSQGPLVIRGSEHIPVSPSCVIFSLNDNRLVFHYAKEPCLWTFDKKVYFKETFNDTIYYVSDNKLEPRFVFNLGKRHIDYENRYKVEGNEDKIVIDYILEGKKALFFVFRINYYNLKDSKTYLGVYNKENNQVKVTDVNEIEDSKNNLLIGKLFTATSDGKLVGLMDSNAFLEKNNNSNLNISEEDNPIIIIIE